MFNENQTDGVVEEYTNSNVNSEPCDWFVLPLPLGALAFYF